ncbi:T3SS effector HopA1 family protein [Pectobacterium betavasculorum]|uniref:Uncharacterized protein n=1 Tax=Pectobacterium betavasculorum TaxID=55207 RepID=A0ABR4V3E0_9GAMM|nr:T3SS effector HopA1 family protein [Pectobacterium betavasculorum]KFX22056.1 hypothetical protein JV35_02540 [Pectobacterium betavasculorum]
MQPITSRFSNIQQLQSSPVDVKKLLDHGALEVNGKTYTISAAEGAKINVELATKAKGFFSAIENMMSSSSESKAIAQILESKPRLLRSNAMHVFDKSAEMIASSSQSVKDKISTIQPDNSQQTLLQWAKQAKGTNHLTESGIYKIYKSDKPNLPAVTPEAGKAMLSKLIRLDGVGRVNVFPQQTGPIGKDLMKGFLQHNPNARNSFMMLRRAETTDQDPTTSRITLSVHPRNAAKLPEILHEMIRDKDYLHSAKVAHPSFFGQDTDSVIFYLNGHLGEAINLANDLKKRLPPDAVVEHNPAGMYPLAKGFSYAENAEGDVTSFGKSRANIIHSALTEKTPGNFEKHLHHQLEAKGYDAKHPAFIKDSPSLAIIN